MLNVFKHHLILLFLITVGISSVTAASTLVLTVQTDKPSYHVQENINVNGYVTFDEVPVQNALVALEIHDPADTPIITRTLNTTVSGFYSTDFTLPPEAILGLYTVHVSCTYSEVRATNSSSFQLEQEPILKVTVGAPRNSYRIDENIVIQGHITLQDAPLPEALVAVEVQDPGGTPVVIRVLETEADGSYQLTFQMPTGSNTGAYTVHASASYDSLRATATTTFQLQGASLPADINGDGRVNIIDISLVALAYGSYPGHDRWNPECDLDGNEVVNIIDIALVARDFGTSF